MDLASPTGDFFAPVTTGAVDRLLAEYRGRLTQIEQVAALFNGDPGAVVKYFVTGNCRRGGYSSVAAESIFKHEGAVAALNADYWSRLLSLTDVLAVMPQARRDEWNEAIQKMQTPDFTDDAVRPTLEGLMSSRDRFFAERVDGLFRALSHEHVTNSPAGFGKRMILAGVLDPYGFTGRSRSGSINDLRCVIARFMGRDEPGYRASETLVTALRAQWGQWQPIDGGALRVRLYRKGTAHIEVHPDMAWRLNCVLASMHPQAIPAEHRNPPKQRRKDWPLMQRPLPFAVLAVLADAIRDTQEKRVLLMSYRDHGAQASEEARRVLDALGGVAEGKHEYVFDYPPKAVLEAVVVSGCLPDTKAYQYYPTPDELAQEVVAAAKIEAQHVCLEPSAGQGALADRMRPLAVFVRCVEVSELHCQVLRAKGHSVVHADFLSWQTPERFDRIVMNPPFSDGRWQAHLDYALGLLRHRGRLVAVLPASARGRVVFPAGMVHWWSSERDNAFPGVSVRVVLLTVVREEDA